MTEASDPETGFLEALGQRVRTMRGLAGMSRKVLAKVSGISERYIAQLESGKGNVSIVLLRRVSNAMGAHLEDLIPAAEPAPDWAVIRDLLRKATPSQIAQAKDALAGGGASAQRRSSFSGIALIGLRGAGKSTLGKMLAKKIGWSFVELNKEIEAQNGLVRRRDHRALRPGRLSAHGAGGARAIAGAKGIDGAGDRRRHRLGAADLRPDPVVVLHHLAQGRAGRTHGARARPRRSAADGGRPLGDGRTAQYPAEPRAALCPRIGRGRYRGAERRCSGVAVDRCGGAGGCTDEARMFARG